MHLNKNIISNSCLYSLKPSLLTIHNVFNMPVTHSSITAQNHIFPVDNIQCAVNDCHVAISPFMWRHIFKDKTPSAVWL